MLGICWKLIFEGSGRGSNCQVGRRVALCLFWLHLTVLRFRTKGPSNVDIAKLPFFEQQSQIIGDCFLQKSLLLWMLIIVMSAGKSDGQIQMFQKNGKAYAYQWSAPSKTWIEVETAFGSYLCFTNAASLLSDLWLSCRSAKWQDLEVKAILFFWFIVTWTLWSSGDFVLF